MIRAYLLIGGNIDNKLAYLQQAAELVEQYCGKIVTASSVFETDAWGITDQPCFYNQALALETHLAPQALMQRLLDIETIMGRTRMVRMGPRIMDLDILLIDDLIIETDTLTVPHPALAYRRFALTPLAEIAPDIVHPILKKSIRLLLAECTDELNVQKIEDGI